MTARKRNSTRKNTRRACGRHANRERSTAPYRAGATASARVIPPAGEGARTRTYATARQTGHQRRFRYRANAAGALALTDPRGSLGRKPGSGPATVERAAS